MKERAPRKRIGKTRRILGDILIAAVVLYTAYLCAVMVHRIKTVVLKDTYRTIFHNELILRVDTAQQYLEEYPDATLILTGGNPDESGRTEAAVMKDLLLERSVPEDRMITEDRAASTRENFINAAQIIDPAEPAVFISSNYHMDRAISMAEEAGFTDIMRLPAPSDPVRYGANIMWEVLLEINEMKTAAQAA